MSQQHYRKLAAELRELYYKLGADSENIAHYSNSSYDYKYDNIANKLYALSVKRTPLTAEDIRYIEEMNRNYYSNFPASSAAGMPKKRGRPSKSKMTGGSTTGMRENMIYHADLIRQGYETLLRDYPNSAPLVHLMTPKINKLYEITNRSVLTERIVGEFTRLYDDLHMRLTDASMRNREIQGSGKPRGRPRKNNVGKGVTGGARSPEEAEGYQRYLESVADTRKVNPGIDWARSYAVYNLPKPLTFEEWKELQPKKKAAPPPPRQQSVVPRQRTVAEALMPQTIFKGKNK